MYHSKFTALGITDQISFSCRIMYHLKFRQFWPDRRQPNLKLVPRAYHKTPGPSSTLNPAVTRLQYPKLSGDPAEVQGTRSDLALALCSLVFRLPTPPCSTLQCLVVAAHAPHHLVQFVSCLCAQTAAGAGNTDAFPKGSKASRDSRSTRRSSRPLMRTTCRLK